MMNEIWNLFCQFSWRADDEPVRSLVGDERQPGLLLEGEHDEGKNEDQGLATSGVSNADLHVSKKNQFNPSKKINISG